VVSGFASPVGTEDSLLVGSEGPGTVVLDSEDSCVEVVDVAAAVVVAGVEVVGDGVALVVVVAAGVLAEGAAVPVGCVAVALPEVVVAVGASVMAVDIRLAV
jgi:hypothetical protein